MLAETGINPQGGAIAAITLLGVGLLLARRARQKGYAPP
jgi:LPXTG-motif cell wall-anchored protein